MVERKEEGVGGERRGTCQDEYEQRVQVLRLEWNGKFFLLEKERKYEFLRERMH